LAPGPDDPLDQLWQERWPRWLHFWPAAVVGGLGLALVLGLAQIREDQLVHEQLVRTQKVLASLSTRAEVIALAAFGPALSMAALVEVDGDLHPTRFEAMAHKLLAADVHLRSITAAPDHVVRMVYSLADNEIIKDRDYGELPAQYASVAAARLRGGPVLVAPVRLLQEFDGILLRVPAFLPSAEGPRY